MTTLHSKADTGMGISVCISTVIHLAVFLLLFWYGSNTLPTTREETYYVDVVNLPVADPRAGSPTQQGNDTPAPPPPVPAEMTAPSPTAPAKAVAQTKQQKSPAARNQNAQQASDLSDRLAKLQQKQEAQQEEATLARLREQVKSQGKGRGGMPNATGKEAGSDYIAYLQSRLKDAFKQTISYTSKNPEMVVRMFIDTNGKVSRKKTEKSSNDTAFEISVLRAIDVASEKFTPPPNHKMFEGVFVFRREGITQNKP